MPHARLSYFLLLGSNQDDPKAQIKQARQKIQSLPDTMIAKSSSLKRTKPYGKVDQADFYNQVIEVKSAQDPEAMMQILLDIETDLGRIRKEKWGPRVIDIDILLIEDMILDTERLKVPHYDLHHRAFALDLLCEIAKDVVHPILQKTMRELLEELDSHGGR